MKLQFTRILIDSKRIRDGQAGGQKCLRLLACFAAFFILFSFYPSSALGAVSWSQAYGAKEDDSGNFVMQTPDGGYLIGGVIGISNHQDFYLLKLDSAGKKIWQNNYGTTADETACWLGVSKDGSIWMAGNQIKESISRPYVIRTTFDGSKVWEQVIAATSSTSIYTAGLDKNGDILLAGTTVGNNSPKQAYLGKISKAGSLLWETSFPSGSREIVHSMVIATDSSVLMAGSSEKPEADQSDILLMKADAMGNQLWSKTIGGSGQDGAMSMLITQDKNILLAGYSSSNPSNGTQCYLAKTNLNGNLLWEKTYPHAGRDIVYSVSSDANGNFVLYCQSQSELGGLSGSYLILTDTKGTKLNELFLGQRGADQITQGIVCGDGQYLLVGNKWISTEQKKDTFLTKIASLSVGQVAAASTANSASPSEAPAPSKGSILWPDQSQYRGYLQNGKASGWGKISFSDGGSYEGGFRDNLFHGQGTLKMPDGSTYKGVFRDNMFYGKGVYKWSTGERYEGDFRYNRRNGEGTFYWSNGVKYEGEFVDDKAHGYGTISWANGEKYTGQMKDGQASGLGSYYFSNKERYVGNLSGLKFEGLGTYYWPSGAKYVGEFKEDLLSGQGTYYWPNGTYQWGYWEDDRYIGIYPEAD